MSQSNLRAAFVGLLLACCAAPSIAGPQSFQTLVADDIDEDDSFGVAVGLGSGLALVGSSRDDNPLGVNAGSVYVFDTLGTQIARLQANDGAASDGFGGAVDVNGDTAVIGAVGDDDNGNSAGSAYLLDLTTLQQSQKLLASDGADVDLFGYSVAIDGGSVVVGAPWDADNGNRSGSAYVFDATSGLELRKLVPDDGAPEERFAWSVDVSGTTAIVGAHQDDENGFQSGSAYLYDVTTGVLLHKLLADDGDLGDNFGFAVAIDGSLAVVGAYADDGRGSAYVFDVNTGQQLLKLTAVDGSNGDQFGASVAIRGTTVLVGAPRNILYGSIYLFDATTGLQTAKRRSLGSGERFGISTAIDEEFTLAGNTSVTGGPSTDGSAALYARSNAFCFGAGCPCGNDSPTGGCANSTGRGGRLEGPFVGSLTSDAMTLNASDLPPSNLGLFFVSTGFDFALPVQNGDGTSCVGLPSTAGFRYRPGWIDSRGTLSLEDPIAGAPPGFFVTGRYAFFQVWSRDVFCPGTQVPCPSPCGTRTNFSNAIEVFIVP